MKYELNKIGTHPIFSKMDYLAVSKTAKRFEQESKVNSKINEIKQKMIEEFRLL
jgi:hypothetical protein